MGAQTPSRGDAPPARWRKPAARVEKPAKGRTNPLGAESRARAARKPPVAGEKPVAGGQNTKADERKALTRKKAAGEKPAAKKCPRAGIARQNRERRATEETVRVQACRKKREACLFSVKKPRLARRGRGSPDEEPRKIAASGRGRRQRPRGVVHKPAAGRDTKTFDTLAAERTRTAGERQEKPTDESSVREKFTMGVQTPSRGHPSLARRTPARRGAPRRKTRGNPRGAAQTHRGGV